MGVLKNIFAAQKLDALVVGKGSPGATRLQRIRKVTVAVDPPNATAGVNVTVSVTVTGVRTGDFVAPCTTPATLETGLVLIGASISGNDTVVLTFFNPTAGAINGASKNWDLLHIRLG